MSPLIYMSPLIAWQRDHHVGCPLFYFPVLDQISLPSFYFFESSPQNISSNLHKNLLTIKLVDQSERLVFQNLNVLVRVGESLTWVLLRGKLRWSRGEDAEFSSVWHGYLQEND
jgi:hypothetical protein